MGPADTVAMPTPSGACCRGSLLALFTKPSGSAGPGLRGSLTSAGAEQQDTLQGGLSRDTWNWGQPLGISKPSWGSCLLASSLHCVWVTQPGCHWLYLGT